jgi:hypothetical protein
LERWKFGRPSDGIHQSLFTLMFLFFLGILPFSHEENAKASDDTETKETQEVEFKGEKKLFSPENHMHDSLQMRTIAEDFFGRPLKNAVVTAQDNDRCRSDCWPQSPPHPERSHSCLAHVCLNQKGNKRILVLCAGAKVWQMNLFCHIRTV